MGAISPFASHVVKMRAVAARRDLRRSQQTRARFWHVVVVSSFFFIVMGTGLFLGAGYFAAIPGKPSLRLRVGPVASPARYRTASSATIFCLTTKQRKPSKTELPVVMKVSPSLRENPSGPSAGAASGLRVTDSIDNCAAPTDSRPTTCLQSQCRETACENSQRKACRWQACRECACAL